MPRSLWIASDGGEGGREASLLPSSKCVCSGSLGEPPPLEEGSRREGILMELSQSAERVSSLEAYARGGGAGGARREAGACEAGAAGAGRGSGGGCRRGVRTGSDWSVNLSLLAVCEACREAYT